jgi:hypothetical protein
LTQVVDVDADVVENLLSFAECRYTHTLWGGGHRFFLCDVLLLARANNDVPLGVTVIRSLGTLANMTAIAMGVAFFATFSFTCLDAVTAYLMNINGMPTFQVVSFRTVSLPSFIL